LSVAAIWRSMAVLSGAVRALGRPLRNLSIRSTNSTCGNHLLCPPEYTRRSVRARFRTSARIASAFRIGSGLKIGASLCGAIRPLTPSPADEIGTCAECAACAHRGILC
jgi:hypothetical protein